MAFLESGQFSCSIVSDSFWPHGLQHARPPCPSPTPRVYSNSCSLSRWCHPTISSSVVPFSSCLQSFPASGSFQMSQLFESGGQSIGASASASVLPRWTGWISLQSKGLSRVFSNTTVQKHQFFGAQLYLSRTNEEGNRQNRFHLESRTPSWAGLWTLSSMPSIYGNDIPTGKPDHPCPPPWKSPRACT